MTVWSPYLSRGPWRRCVDPWLFQMALLVLAGSRAAVLTEASCFGYIHAAVLAQSLAAVWQLGQRGPWMGHYNVSGHRGNTYSNRGIVCSRLVLESGLYLSQLLDILYLGLGSYIVLIRVTLEFRNEQQAFLQFLSTVKMFATITSTSRQYQNSIGCVDVFKVKVQLTWQKKSAVRATVACAAALSIRTNGLTLRRVKHALLVWKPSGTVTEPCKSKDSTPDIQTGNTCCMSSPLSPCVSCMHAFVPSTMKWTAKWQKKKKKSFPGKLLMWNIYRRSWVSLKVA